MRHFIFFVTDNTQSHSLLTIGRLGITQIIFDSGKIRISVFFMREHTVLVYILQKKQNNALYIFSNGLYSEPFSFNFGAPRYYLYLFQFAYNQNFGILHERAYEVNVYTPKQSRTGHCIFLLTDYIQRNSVFNIGVPR